MENLLKRSRLLLIMLAIILALSPLSVLAEGENENTINYVALGDSLAAGVLSDGSKGTGYVGLIQGDLEAKGYEVNVHNAGYPGFKTGNVLENLPMQELATADIITVSVGANDILAVFKPILESGTNPADLTLEKVAELKQKAENAALEAELAVRAAESAKNAASGAISDETMSVNEAELALAKVEQAATEAIAGLSASFPVIPTDVQALLDSAVGFIQDAKGSLDLAGSDINDGRENSITDAQVTAGSLDSAAGNIGAAVQKLNSLKELINSIPISIPQLQKVVDEANKTIESANIVKSKVESAKLAINTYITAKADAESAQLAASTAATKLSELATKLTEIDGAFKGISTNTAKILGAIEKVNPSAKVYVMGYYNALYYLPYNVQPMLNMLNEAIAIPTSTVGYTFVPVADLFEGKYQTYLPNPLDIHPSTAGYQALADGFMAKIGADFPEITFPSPEIELGDEVLVNPGQVIRIKDTNVTLALPSDLPEGTTLTVTKTGSEALTVAKAGELELFGDALDFDFKYSEDIVTVLQVSEDEVEVEPFTLTMGYNANSPDNVAIYHFNEENGKWEIQQGEINEDSQTISLDVTHFSNYGVFAKVEKPDETPIEPVDPEDPVTDPEEDDDDSNNETPPPGTKKPSDKSKDDNKKDNKKPKKETKKDTKNKLPNTATNHFNALLLGTSLLGVGAMMFIVITRKRRLVTEK